MPYKDPEQRKIRDREYRKRNAEKISADQRKRYVRDRENRLAYSARRLAHRLLNNARTHSKKTGAPFSLTLDFVEKELAIAEALGLVTRETRCPDTASLDQIIPGKGYTESNTQIAPMCVNFAYHDFDKSSVDEVLTRYLMYKKSPTLEKNLERHCVSLALSQGWWVRKFSSPRHVGVPDRIFAKNGRIRFIEFKQEGKQPTDIQWKEILDIQDHGGEAYWCDNVPDFLLLMTEVVDEAAREARARLSLCPNDVLFRIGRPCR